MFRHSLPIRCCMISQQKAFCAVGVARGKKLESIWNAEGQSPPFHIATLTDLRIHEHVFLIWRLNSECHEQQYQWKISSCKKRFFSSPSRNLQIGMSNTRSRRTPKNTDNARRHSPRHVRKIQNFSSFVQPKGLWKGSSCSWIPFVTWRISTVWGFWMGVITIICDMNTQWKRYCIWWQDQSYLLQVWSIWWIIIISLMTTINVMSMIDLIWSRQSRRRYGSIWYTDWTVSGIHEKWHDIITRII